MRGEGGERWAKSLLEGLRCPQTGEDSALPRASYGLVTCQKLSPPARCFLLRSWDKVTRVSKYR